MKIAPAQYKGFCNSVPQKIRSVLFYGDSEADITPKLDKFVQQGMHHKISEFQIIDASDLLKKDVFLTDLISSPSLFGPPRPVMIQKATDKIVSILQNYLEQNKEDGIVVVISDSYLKPSSKLRQLYEKEETLGAVACYARTLPEVTQNIIEIVQSFNKNMGRMAAQALAEKIIQGTAPLETEINKIIDYVGPDQKNIELTDIQECTVLNLETTEKQIYEAFLRKKWAEIPFLFLETSGEGINGIAVLRGLNGKLSQLLAIKSLIEEGKNIDQASRMVAPPIFFQEKEIMHFAAKTWKVDEIKYILNKLVGIEQSIKYDASVANSLFSMAFFSELLKKKWKKG